MTELLQRSAQVSRDLVVLAVQLYWDGHFLIAPIVRKCFVLDVIRQPSNAKVTINEAILTEQ